MPITKNRREPQIQTSTSKACLLEPGYMGLRMPLQHGSPKCCGSQSSHMKPLERVWKTSGLLCVDEIN